MDHYGNFGDGRCGMFEVPSCIDRQPLTIVASSDLGWDHVSVSRRNRVPSWLEMAQIKRLFFRADEVAMQLHVAEIDHVNFHPYCLHLWRPLVGEIPLPPKNMVA